MVSRSNTFARWDCVVVDAVFPFLSSPALQTPRFRTFRGPWHTSHEVLLSGDAALSAILMHCLRLFE